MAKSYTKLEQALKDLIESYTEIEQEIETKHGDDTEAMSSELLEILEGSIETALEEHDYSAGSFASLLSILSEGLEQIDPSAFEDDAEEDDEDETEDYDMSDVDYDIDDEEELEEDDIEDYDEDEDDEDE